MVSGKWIIGVALISVLAACSGSAPDAIELPATARPTEVMQAPSVVAPTEDLNVNPAASEAVAPSGATMSAPMTEPTAVDDDAIPTGSSALHASNPATASLSGDKPRFVEFFAFW
ncbi:MAG: hypothetical protein WBR18_07020 [Anaerolineales bacterium]